MDKVDLSGIITGADSVFRLEKIVDGKYRMRISDGASQEVEIEDSIMVPIVSGPDAKR